MILCFIPSAMLSLRCFYHFLISSHSYGATRFDFFGRYGLYVTGINQLYNNRQESYQWIIKPDFLIERGVFIPFGKANTINVRVFFNEVYTTMSHANRHLNHFLWRLISICIINLSLGDCFYSNSHCVGIFSSIQNLPILILDVHPYSQKLF